MQIQRNKSALSDIQKAKLKSKRVDTIKDMMKRLHDNRLNTLLHSNELQRVTMYGDGNCFFKNQWQCGGGY